MLIKHVLPSLLLALALSAYTQREMGMGVPKHIPIKINVKNLVFQALNFGDGTGYMDTQGTPVDKHKQVR